MDFSSPAKVVARITSAISGYHSNSTDPIQELYEAASCVVSLVKSEKTSCFEKVFEIVEQSIIWGTQDTRDLIIIGFLESLKNISAVQDLDYEVFESWLGPETHVAWRWLEKKWKGKSMADTLRERDKQ